MIILRNIKVPYDKDEKFLRGKIEKELNKKDFDYKIYKKSLDARREINYVYQVLVDLDLKDIDKKTLRRLKNNIDDFHEEKYFKEKPYTLSPTSEFEVQADELFVLGDNRSPDGSVDSRIFGPIKIKNIRSHPFYRIFPINSKKLINEIN